VADAEATASGRAPAGDALADVRAECAALAATLDARPARDEELETARAATERIVRSVSWRVAAPLRLCKRLVLEAREAARLARRYYGRRRGGR
jgi:hypothetical protein